MASTNTEDYLPALAQTGAHATEREGFSLGNRRYLGSKSKILDEIEAQITASLGRYPSSLVDAFAGSGVVGARFAARGTKVIMNDILLHNAIAHETFLLHAGTSLEHLEFHLRRMEEMEPVEGYISQTFGGRYFSRSSAGRLDAWREYITENIRDEYLKKAALTSMLYAADKIAQTVGHYDAFLNRHQAERTAKLRMPIRIGTGMDHLVFQRDANEVVANIEAEVVYLDPPYNSRQYSDTYHVLENIAQWEKPEVFGVARKMDRSHLKSRYSGRKANEAFRELVESAKAQLIVLSYSNTGDSRVSRSNNVLLDEMILGVLASRGNVRVVEIQHNEFSVGRTSKREHRERLFVCEVNA